MKVEKKSFQKVKSDFPSSKTRQGRRIELKPLAPEISCSSHGRGFEAGGRQRGCINLAEKVKVIGSEFKRKMK